MEHEEATEHKTHVAVLILDQPLRVAVQLVEEAASLRWGAILEDALQDAAAVRVRGESVNLTDAGVRNERDLVAGYSLEGALWKKGQRLLGRATSAELT